MARATSRNSCALLPAMFLLMTSFTRILIVLHFLRSAIGTQTTPPGQLLVALAVLLTGVVMHPIVERANTGTDYFFVFPNQFP